MTTYTVTSGQTISGLFLNDGDGFYVIGGGTAVATTADAGGVIYVSSGGVASGTVLIGANLSAAVENVSSGGIARGTIVSGGGEDIVSAAGIASATTILSGGTEEALGGVTTGSIVSAGGGEYVASGGAAFGAIVSQGGVETLAALGTAGGTMLLGGEQLVSAGATASGTTASAGGVQDIRSGGTAIDTNVNIGGGETVEIGGLSIGTTLNGESGAAGGDTVYGAASGTIVYGESNEIVSAGGVAVGTRLIAGNQTVYGTASGTVISAGGGLANMQLVGSGGIASGTVVLPGTQNGQFFTPGGFQRVTPGGESIGTIISGGSELIDPGGVALGTRLFGGSEAVVGSASGTVASGGLVSVQFGSTTGTMLLGGGIEIVSSGGVTYGTVVNSGSTQYISSGGQSVGTVLDGGGVQHTDEFVGGGVASGTLVNGGTAYVDSGGLDVATVINAGGTQIVSSGASASGVVIDGGGAQFVSSGGVASNTTVSGGGIEVLSAGSLVGFTTLLPGGSIDWPGLVFSGGGSAVLNAQTDSLTVTEGGDIYQVRLAGDYSGDTFVLAADSGGGTLVTAQSVAIANGVAAAYTGILRTPPTTAELARGVTQIEDGPTTVTQFQNELIASEQTIWSTLPALVTIDAFYDATPASALLTTVATATSGTSYYTAAELHNEGYSDPNLWSILGAGWGADPTSNFYGQYDADATGTTAGYTAFINAAYQTEFGAPPSAANLQNLLGDVPGLTTLLSGGGDTATPIQIMGGLYGYLLYAGQSYGIGHYASAADAFLQAAANGNVTYGPELTAEFPSTSGTAEIAADPSVITVTGSDQLIDPGVGNHMIQFLPDAGADTLTSYPDGVDQVSGFDPGTDAPTLGVLLARSGVDLTGGFSAPANYTTFVEQGAGARLRYDPTGQGGGTTVAVSRWLGGTVTSPDESRHSDQLNQ